VVLLVLAPIVAALLWTANRQLEGILLNTGSERAQASADQVAQVIGQNTARGFSELQRLAARPAVRQALVAPDRASLDAAAAVLAPLAVSGQPPISLVDASRRVVLQLPAGDDGAARPLGLPVSLDPGISPFVANEGQAAYFIVAAVTDADGVDGTSTTRGAVVVPRRLGSAPNAELLSRLVGAGAVVALGSDGVWTDFSRLIPAPRIDTARRGAAAYTTVSGEARLGALAPIDGTPWFILVDMPQALLLAPVHAVLWTIGGVAAVSIALGFLVMMFVGTRVDRTHRDLTARVREGTAGLERATREMDRFFSVSIDLFCIADFDGCFRRVNEAWRDVLGWEPSELTARPYAEFVHPDDRAATAAEAGRLSGGTPVLSFENRYRHKDGSYRWLRWVSMPVVEDGLIYASARDVTHERELSASLESHVTSLAEVNRELESFSYSVSHDLRAPLRHITGFAALLERSAGETLGERDRRYLTTITGAANRMGRLIDDLLSFSRTGRAALAEQPVDLQALVEDVRKEAQEDARPSADRPIDWVVGPLPTVTGDREMLRVALVNLLANAVKYSSTRPAPRIEIGMDGGPRGPALFVRDNGVGFDAQYAHKLFGVFQRLHSSDEFEGTGIGLAIVRQIVRRHGGEVWAEGAVDRGATFHVWLPTMGETRR
jgi:PAS domain S-box-containing protein